MYRTKPTCSRGLTSYNLYKDEPARAIKVTLPDGKVVEGVAGKTTPLDVAAGISKELRDETVVAKVS